MDNVLPLRDIHLPPDVSAFPPAFGWWILATLLIAALVAAILFYRRGRIRRAAGARLKAIAEAYATHGDARQLVTDVSTLLRRVCLSYGRRRELASITGNAWRNALNTLPKPAGRFSEDVAEQIVRAPYDPRARVAPDTLLEQTRRWVRALPASSRAA